MSWDLQIGLHFPHERFALGWEWFRPDQNYDYTTVRLFLFMVTLTLNF